jgi:hypothetical protein
MIRPERRAGPATGGRRVTLQGDDVQSDNVRGGDRMRRARRSHAQRAPFILAEAEGRLWCGEPEERWRSEGEGPNEFGLARPWMRARVFYRWPTRLVSAGACVCRATDHRKQVGGRWCGSGTGAATLRMVAQVCRQCTHRSSQVKEGFLCEQRCSVGHALASHVRGQRKFNS